MLKGHTFNFGWKDVESAAHDQILGAGTGLETNIDARTRVEPVIS
jgi:hypothetical protein